MCRFLSYSGPSTLMDDYVFKCNNSLVEQSKHAKMRENPVNGDGFGIGWYPEHNDIEPGTFVSIEPAWSNRNLIQLASKVRTQHFFAHIRDASVGMPVSQSNCHPFCSGRYLWMHNGRLDQFEKIRRAIVNQLSDQAFKQVQGNTDSEYAFALFLDQINFDNNASLTMLRDGLYKTIEIIMRLRAQVGANSNAFMNFAVTNGESSLFTRFNSHEEYRPASLFYKVNTREDDPAQKVTIVSSEPLSVDKTEWIKVERNHLVMIENNGSVHMEKIPLPFQSALKN